MSLKNTKLYLIIAMFLFVSACIDQTETSQVLPKKSSVEKKQTEKTEKSNNPDLQAEILNEENSKTDSPLGRFDFTNFTYPSPRGWQDIDGNEFTLENGKRQMSEEKIGMGFVTTKFFDVTGDENDEAFVILKVLTGSITIPQLVYIYEWKNEQPELLWYFRTGDRSDGGLKRIYHEDGNLAIELFGPDRYIFNQMETTKIVGDEQDLCCPTHFTKTVYKYEGGTFKLQGDRWTFSLEDKNKEPIKNLNDKQLEEERGS